MLEIVDSEVRQLVLLVQAFPFLWSNRSDLGYGKIFCTTIFYSIFLGLYICNEGIHRGFRFLLKNPVPELIFLFFSHIREALFQVQIIQINSFLFLSFLFRQSFNLLFLWRSYRNRSKIWGWNLFFTIFVFINSSCDSFETDFQSVDDGFELYK